MLLCRKTFETTENYIGLQNEQNDELRHKTFKTTQNNESDQITMNLHRFDVQTIKNVELRRKPFKTAKLQKWSKYNDFHRFDVKTTQNCKSNQITMNLHRFDVKMIKNVELRRKTFKQRKTTKVIKCIGRQNEQNWPMLMSQNIQNYAKQRKWSNYDEFASIWRPNDQKCWVTSQTIQNR